MRRKAKKTCDYYPPAYALRPGPFRTYQACEGKISYHFLYEDGQFSDPNYNFFLQTQLLANKLLSGMEGYSFYVQIFAEAAHHVALEEVIALACWKDDKDIDFLSRENLGLQSILQKFSFFTRNLDVVSQNATVISEGKLDGVTSIFADYYAIRVNGPKKEMSCISSDEQIKRGADFALISDDIHGVWTILHTEKYSQNLLIENLGKFCDTYSAKLNIYP